MTCLSRTFCCRKKDRKWTEIALALQLISRTSRDDLAPIICSGLFPRYVVTCRGNYNGSTSTPFLSGVKEGRALAPTNLSYAFGSPTGGVYLHTVTDGKLFNHARLKAKTKRRVLIRKILFVDNAALATHVEEDLQKLVDRFAHACKEFGLTISIKKTNVIGQDVIVPLSINIGNVTFDVVDQITYLGKKITSNLSLDAEFNMRIAKAAAVMSMLSKRMWFDTFDRKHQTV